MKVLMVCLGNICRSPLAHGILQQLADEAQLNCIVESAGTGSWHVGNPPDKRSIAAAKKLGYDISKQRAVHFKASFLADYDHIFVMDKHNYADVIAMAKNDVQRNKVKLFLGEGDVTDPYYDDALFAPVCKQVEARCKVLVQELAKL